MNASATPLRVLLIGGIETRFHHFSELGPALSAVITSANHHVTQLLAKDALTANVLREFDALVSITTGGELSEAQETALLTAIAEPKNDRGEPLHFLGVHGASCSFTSNPRYLAMLGGRFLRHPPMTTFRVAVDVADHPVTRGVDAFEIYDELYVLELLSEVHVLLSAENPERGADGADGAVNDSSSARLPLGWVRQYGRGKVGYLALGHGPEQIAHPSLGRMVRQALAWFGGASDSKPAPE